MQKCCALIWKLRDWQTVAFYSPATGQSLCQMEREALNFDGVSILRPSLRNKGCCKVIATCPEVALEQTLRWAPHFFWKLRNISKCLFREALSWSILIPVLFSCQCLIKQFYFWICRRRSYSCHRFQEVRDSLPTDLRASESGSVDKQDISTPAV